MSNSIKKPYDDIPGTPVFTTERMGKGFHLNQFCMSLMKSENRERFLANERAYLDEWPMTEVQKQGILDRDLTTLVEHGGNIYYLAKIGATDKQSMVQIVSSMTDSTPEEYQQMMKNGGRTPEGNRYK